MKKSFIVYTDSLNILSDLTAEQAGELFKAIYNYHSTGQLPSEFWLKIALTPFVNQWERDAEKWEQVKQVRRESGRKGGLMKAQNNPNNPVGSQETQTKQMVANAKNAKQTLANVAVNVNDNVNVNGNVNVTKEKKSIKKEIQPPTLEEVKAWFTEQGSTAEQGAKAWQYYTDGNWHDAKGQPVKNWRQKMRGGRWLEVKAPNTVLHHSENGISYQNLSNENPNNFTELNDFFTAE
jgi:hypothetical protein